MKSILLLLFLAMPAASQTCPGCIQNSANPQNAEFNVGTGTIRGLLTVGSLNINSFTATTLSATSISGGGSGITGLSASNIASGNISSSVVVGAYPGITQVGTLSGGAWQGSIVGTQYGGTGQNFINISTGSIIYFSGVGQMATLLAGSPLGILQTNGNAPPTWTQAPQVSGANIYGISLAALSAGTLPSNIIVSSNSIPIVAGASVLGNISGQSSGVTGPILLNQLSTGTLPSSIPASSITVTGVAPGTFGGPGVYTQINIGTDGRIYTATQGAIAITPSQISAGALPSGVTVPPTNISGGALPGNVVASSITNSGIMAGTYGDATHSVQVTFGNDGRATSVTSFPIIGGGAISTGTVAFLNPTINTSGITVTSGTFTASGPNQYSIVAASGASFGGPVNVSAFINSPAIYSVSFIGGGAGINNINPANLAAGALFSGVTISTPQIVGYSTGTSSSNPGGPFNSIQFNNAGAFGGSVNFVETSTGVTNNFPSGETIAQQLIVGGSINGNGAINTALYYQIAGSTVLSNPNGTDVFVGPGAGGATFGNSNVFVGRNAGNNNTASGNTFIGDTAGFNNTSGQNNTYIGQGAGNPVTSGNDNVMLGNTTGATNSGSENVILGFDAGNQMISANGTNIFLGSNAGRNSIGSHNIFIGYNAGLNVGASYRLLISSDVGGSLISGDLLNNMVAIAKSTPTATLDVNGNIKALTNIITEANYMVDVTTAIRSDLAAPENIFFWNAGSAYSGHNNTFGGYQSGASNSAPNGWNNTYWGYQAGMNVTNNGDNTMVGSQAGLGVDSPRNSFFGRSAGNGATNQDNSCFGDSACLNSTGQNNTWIGESAGHASTGSFSEGLGDNAGEFSMGSHSLYLGYQAGTSAPGDNKLYIANGPIGALIYGDFSAGFVGINLTSASAALDINGSEIVRSTASILGQDSSGDSLFVSSNIVTAGCIVFPGGRVCGPSSGGGGGGSPGGGNTAVQFNNSSSFGGDATNFSWDNTNKNLTITGLTTYGALTASQLRTASCSQFSAGATGCMIYNSDDFDLYTSTGSGSGQWRNTRTGVGP